MRFLHRTNEQPSGHAGGGDGGPASGDQLQQIRADAERMLAAGDEIIRGALSGNAQEFLHASRQQGGQ